jgi:hypothetical protein
MKIGPSGPVLFLYTLAACTLPVPAAAQAVPSAAGAKGEGWIVVAAGDVSCDPRSGQYKEGHGTARYCHALTTSNLVVSLRPAAVLVLGDSQYDSGAPDAYRKAWANNWGRSELKDITHPSAGNHEYNTPDASGYFDWFGPQAGERGKGYYSFDLGTWHLVA